MMEIADMADRPVDELSGGQRQRVWIALALAQQTDILSLDEPTTFLDIAYQVEILDLLTDLNRRRGTTIVMVLHDINLSAKYAVLSVCCEKRKTNRAGIAGGGHYGTAHKGTVWTELHGYFGSGLRKSNDCTDRAISQWRAGKTKIKEIENRKKQPYKIKVQLLFHRYWADWMQGAITPLQLQVHPSDMPLHRYRRRYIWKPDCPRLRRSDRTDMPLHICHSRHISFC